MKQARLGQSGIVVSEICLGTMTFGTQATKEESFAIMDRAVKAGIDFFDAAEIYPVPPTAELAGLTEEWITDWMRERKIPREQLIIATKIAGAAHGWFSPPVRHGKAALDRVHIRRAVEGSLRRLQTDYLDLYQVHWPDHGMRAADTLSVLDELVREGKVRAIGLSNDTAYGLMKSLSTSDLHQLVRVDTIQNNFSLNNRRFEDELAQCCRQESISCLPYSPLAGGVLTGKYQKNGAEPVWPEGARFTTYMDNAPPRQRAMAERFVNPRALESTARFAEIADDLGMDLATMATAWSKQHDFVASTIIGASHVDQLEPILAAKSVTLDKATLARIDRVSREIMYPMG